MDKRHRNDLLGRNRLDKVTDFYQGLTTFQTSNGAIPTVLHSAGLGSDRFSLFGGSREIRTSYLFLK